MGKAPLEADWGKIRAWRIAIRKELLARRRDMAAAHRARIRASIGDLLRTGFPELRKAAIGFYWPIKGEVDLRPFITEALAHGADAALPVVVEKGQALEFWRWTPETTMSRGAWNIPTPRERNPIQVTALLIPVLGFDLKGYRLGYGGGYYDRTLAVLDPNPVTIGVGHDLARLETIYPQPHDIPMDAIVTETGYERFTGLEGEISTSSGRDVTRSTYASPACSLHHFDFERD